MRSDEETIEEFRKVFPKMLDLKNCKSELELAREELELAREEYAKLSNFCMDLVDEKYNLKYELDKKEKELVETMQLMQEVQEMNKGLHALNEKLCKSLKKANRDFAIVAVLLWIVATIGMIYFSFII